MINTNGVRIARDDRFLEGLAELLPTIYLQFDGLERETYRVKQVMKCCVGVLVPDGRMIPFCAYNAVGYREQVPASLSRQQPT